MYRVLLSPDGRTLGSSGQDTTIILWDIQTGGARRVLQGHTGAVTGLAFTPDSRTLLSSSPDGTMRVWDVQSGQCTLIIGGYNNSLLDLDWSPDGTQLASCGADTLVTLWNVYNGTLHSELQDHRDIVQGQEIAWSPDGRLLASGGRDYITICLIKLQPNTKKLYTTLTRLQLSFKVLRGVPTDACLLLDAICKKYRCGM